MSFIMNIIDILFIIGILYGTLQILPSRVRERAGRALVTKPSAAPVESETEGAAMAGAGQEGEAMGPAAEVEETREEDPFLEYVREHLNENLQVVERIAPGEPDLLVESLNFKEKFYIEAWFIESLTRKLGRLGLEIKNLEGYRKLRRDSGREIFFLVGLGGYESSPKTIYIIPLEYAEDFIPVERLRKFERPEPDLPIMYYYRKLR